MKHFLNLSSALVCGIAASYALQAHGWWGFAACLVGGTYIQATQWYVGRYYK